MKRIISVILVAVIVFFCAGCGHNGEEYDRGLSLIEEGQYQDAYEVFSSLGKYKKSQELCFYINELLIIDFNEMNSSVRELVYNTNRLNVKSGVNDYHLSNVNVISCADGYVIVRYKWNCVIIVGDTEMPASDYETATWNYGDYGIDEKSASEVVIMSIPQIIEYAKK